METGTDRHTQTKAQKVQSPQHHHTQYARKQRNQATYINTSHPDQRAHPLPPSN